MSRTTKPKNKRSSKRIPTLLECAGGGHKRKESTADNAGRMWGTLGQEGRPFERPDGSVGVDKTLGVHSRPSAKQAVRNANRGINKKARQLLKRDLASQAEDAT